MFGFISKKALRQTITDLRSILVKKETVIERKEVVVLKMVDDIQKLRRDAHAKQADYQLMYGTLVDIRDDTTVPTKTRNIARNALKATE